MIYTHDSNYIPEIMMKGFPYRLHLFGTFFFKSIFVVLKSLIVDILIFLSKKKKENLLIYSFGMLKKGHPL